MNIIDLFAGCGGLTTGFEMAGFNSVLAVEMDNGAAETYKFNHPNTKVLIEDITKIDKISEYIPNDKIEDGIDGVIGGPSCFTGDTLVLTSCGYIPIKEVQIGDKVILKKGIPLYKSSNATSPASYNSKERITNITRIAKGSKHPYNTTGDLGWMDESSITLYEEPKPTYEVEIELTDKDNLIDYLKTHKEKIVMIDSEELKKVLGL